MRYLSLFSGIEAASVAWEPLGWQPVAFAEVEPAACSVLRHHYPNVPNLGDVTEITESQIQSLGHIDLVVFGSPCQDFSLAGKRAGLKGERSGLFFAAMRIVRRSGARFALWENVPGVFSSHGGRDFARVVGEMVGIQPDVPDGGWRNAGFFLGPDGLAEWAVLDAQWFGVPQRRRRVFALRDIGAWNSRPPILLEPESLQGHPAPRRKAGETVTGTLAARFNGGGGLGTEVIHALRAAGHDAGEDGTGRGIPLVISMSCDGGLVVCPYDIIASLTASGRGVERTGESRGQDPLVVCMSSGQANAEILEDQVTALTRLHEAPIVAREGSAVRRLTPLECSRAQGFPDDYLAAVHHRGKPLSDSAKYALLGNSMAVPVMAWIGQRIQNVLDGRA